MNNFLNFTQSKNEDFKKIEKLQEKAIRITNFLPLNAPVLAPNNPWCKMLQTLLGREKHEEVMSDEQPLKLYLNKKWRFQKDRKTSRKSNKNNKFSALKCSSWKTEVWNEYTKGIHHPSKYLICKRLPKRKCPR